MSSEPLLTKESPPPRSYVLHLLVPPLWVSFIITTCILVKMRVSFQKQLIGLVTPAILMCALFFVILAMWIVDYARPSSLRNSLFRDQLVYIVINVLTLLSMSVLLVIGYIAVRWLYGMRTG